MKLNIVFASAIMTTPLVPRFESTVGVEPLQAPRARGVGPDAFGAGLGEGLSQSSGIMSQIAKDERAKAVRTMTIDGRTKLGQVETDLLYHQENGALTKRGKDAFSLEEPTLRAFDEKAAKIEQEMADPEAKQAFKLFAAQSRVNIDKQIQRHVFSEIKTYADQSNKASLESTLNNISQHYNDPERIDQERKFGLGVIMSDTDNKGLPPEVVKAKVASWESMAHAAVIDKLMVDNPIAAQEYFNDNKDNILPHEATKIERTLKPLATKQTAMDTALELGQGFSGIKNPLELAKVVESAISKAQTQLKDNPDAVNLAETQLNQMAARREHGIRIERAEAARPINTAMANARRDGRIPSLSDFNNEDWTNLVVADPDKADDILRLITNEQRIMDDRKQAKADRAEAKNDRMEARQERDAIRQERAERKKIQDNNYAGLWGNPAALVDADLEGMVAMGYLTPEDGKKLEMRQKGYDPAHILAEAHGVDKVLKAAKIKPESDEDKAVKKFVADRITLLKEKPTPEQVTQFAREALADVDVVVWNRMNKPAYKMTMADVPAKDAALIRDALTRRGRPASDAAVIQIYAIKQTKGAK